MDVQMIEKRDVPLASGAKQTFPAGWSGNVPNEIGAQWVAEGAAVPVLGASAQSFTPEQHAILALVADETLRMAEQQTLQGTDGGAATGGPEQPAADEGGELQLADLTKAELLGLAEGIDGAARMNKADLIAAIEARQAAVESETEQPAA